MASETDPASQKPALAATSWALLGMMSYEEEVSGYDLKKWIDWVSTCTTGARPTARSTPS